MSSALLASNQPQPAIDAAKWAQKLARQAGSFNATAKALERLADVLEQVGQIDDALRTRQEQLEQWRNAGELDRLVLSLGKVVDLASKLGDTRQVLDALRQNGFEKNTIVVLWSDHGWHLGEKMITGKNTLWDDGTRVPLIFAGPGVEGGQVCSKPAELLDIYPTLCDAAGLPVPKHCEGKSLLPLLENPQREWSELACSQYRKGKVIGRSIRIDCYRFTIWEKPNDMVGIELYDHEKDPQGNVNLAASPENKKRVADMTKLHRRKWPEK